MRARNDLDLYERHADAWWDPESRIFRSLRSVGAFHVGLIRRQWGGTVEGSRVAELGCGGGFVSLGLARLGARVVGLDRSGASVRSARAEAARQGLRARFLRGDLHRCPMPSAALDFVVMPDVLEHVERPDLAIREAARLVRPGGGVFVNTLDRTLLSRVAAVELAERIGLVPRGTHDADLFVRPAELVGWASDAGLTLERLVRERPRLVRTALTWTIHLKESGFGPGYSVFLRRPAP